MARVRGRPTESLDAYDCVLKAMSQLYLFTDESFRETAELLERAIALDPNYAQAHAYTAWRLNFLVGEGRSPDPDADRGTRLEAARGAIELDPEDAFALAVAGHVLPSVADGRRRLWICSKRAGNQRELGVRLGAERADLRLPWAARMKRSSGCATSGA